MLKGVNVQTKEQLKRIEERRLIEESNFEITKLLFQDDKTLKKEPQNENIQKEIKNIQKSTRKK